jgi:hypothetical protein
MNIPIIWVKNTDGRPDAVLTFAVLGFTVILLKLLFHGLHIVLGTYLSFTVQGIDATTIAAVLIPTLGAYVSNKYVTLTQHPDYLKARMNITSGVPGNVTTSPLPPPNADVPEVPLIPKDG